MRLYRGIAVPPAEARSVAAEIRGHGLSLSPKATWRIGFFDRRAQLSELRVKPDLTIADTRGEQSDDFICACGGEVGAAYYALCHNNGGENTAPLVIAFSVEIERVFIDGRDFLYSVFQFGRSPERVDAVLRFFGAHALEYAERAWNADHTQQQYRIAMCDLACQDPQVVLDHYSNTTLIEGRYNTRFESAFLVACPVPAANIHFVRQPRGDYDFRPAVRLYDFPRG